VVQALQLVVKNFHQLGLLTSGRHGQHGHTHIHQNPDEVAQIRGMVYESYSMTDKGYGCFCSCYLTSG
jgi:hypothetical protein